MNILVCLKTVPATTEVAVDGSFRLCRDGVKLQYNIADEAALEHALELRSSGDTVTVLTMGPKKVEGSLQELLARGADRVVLLSDPTLGGADTYATALALTAAIDHIGKPDLIICGRRALDGETGQVPPMVSAMLDIPCITDCESLEIDEGILTACRTLEKGVATLQTPLPALVSMREYSAILRLPSLMSLRRAKDKNVEILTADDLAIPPELRGLPGSKTKVTAMTAKFPGLRKGAKETDLGKFAKTVAGEVAG